VPASGADGAVSEDGPGQKNPVWSEGPWGRAAGPLERRCSSAHRPPAQNGDPTRVAGSTKDKGKPTEARVASNGKALSDKPALKPYWGKPTVRKRDQEKQVCSVGDRPTKAKVRSLVAWIAGRRETEFPKPIDKAIFQDGEQVIGPWSSRQSCESSGVKVLVPSIACIRAVSMSGACGGNEARSART